MFAKLFIIISVFLGNSHASWNVTCDFDLAGIEGIIKYLPVECQEIYKKGNDSELYQSSFDESRNFAKLYKNLEEYEKQESSTPPNEIAKQNTTLRFDIYNRTKLHTCAMEIADRTDLPTESDKAKEYYNCLSLKRDQMIELIPREEEEMSWDIAN